MTSFKPHIGAGLLALPLRVVGDDPRGAVSGCEGAAALLERGPQRPVVPRVVAVLVAQVAAAG